MVCNFCLLHKTQHGQQYMREFDRVATFALDDEGFPRAAFDIEEGRDHAKKIADLKIRVISLGPPTNVKKITFAGNTEDSDDDGFGILVAEVRDSTGKSTSYRPSTLV